MMTAAMSRRAQELASAGAPFVTATVVRARRPTSVQPGDVALVLADGTIEGFVGGVCTEHSVRAYALRALERGEAVLLRVLPFDEDGPPPLDQTSDDGAVTVQNPCLSGGSMEVFLEPVLPAPRVLVVGETPIAAALLRLGGELDLDVVTAPDRPLVLRQGDLAVVVAAHGRDELQALRAALEAGVPYVGLVAEPQARHRRAGRAALGRRPRRAAGGGSTFRPASTSGPARRPRSRCRSWPGSSRCAAASGSSCRSRRRPRRSTRSAA